NRRNATFIGPKEVNGLPGEQSLRTRLLFSHEPDNFRVEVFRDASAGKRDQVRPCVGVTPGQVSNPNLRRLLRQRLCIRKWYQRVGHIRAVVPFGLWTLDFGLWTLL